MLPTPPTKQADIQVQKYLWWLQFVQRELCQLLEDVGGKIRGRNSKVLEHLSADNNFLQIYHFLVKICARQ
jgi:hypothetical protein